MSVSITVTQDEALLVNVELDDRVVEDAGGRQAVVGALLSGLSMHLQMPRLGTETIRLRLPGLEDQEPASSALSPAELAALGIDPAEGAGDPPA